VSEALAAFPQRMNLWEHGSVRLSCHFACFVVPNALVCIPTSPLNRNSETGWRQASLPDVEGGIFAARKGR
jgi:hypothetical protein